MISKAADTSTDTSLGMINSSIETSVDAISHPWVFFDLDFGYSWLNVSRQEEIDKRGTFLSLRCNVSLDFDYFALEGGGGIFSTTLVGRNSKKKERASVTSLLTEGGALWIFTQEWRLGGKARWIFGTETDFGPVEKAKKNNLLVSIDGIYQFEQYNNLRLGAHYQYDLTIPRREFNALLLSVGVGFQVIKKQ